jgi:ubiquinone/menaquinone biosynthesis C-methylase UbiE
MKDIHVFSGRGSNHILTEFINRKILTELVIEPHDRLVDIGCGDGTLLRAALQAGVSNPIGLSGTVEEASRLRALGLNTTQAYADCLPLPDQCASAIVCNSVLHIVPEDKIPASLREIARIAEPKARIWIGEIPRFREPASIRAFETVPEMLWWLLRNRGLRTFLGKCRQVLTGVQRGPELRTAQSFWAEPERFIHMAGEAGLKVERNFPHQILDAQQRPCISPTRHDYLLRRA